MIKQFKGVVAAHDEVLVNIVDVARLGEHILLNKAPNAAPLLETQAAAHEAAIL